MITAMKTTHGGTVEKLRQEIYKVMQNKENKDLASKQIFNQLVKLDAYNKATTVLCYMSLKNEVDTSYIIEDALKNKKTVGLPITNKHLKFVSVDKSTIFKRGVFGVREPVTGTEIKDFDLIIVPMVAFDSDCNRMGHGKGYYDKFLENKSCLKIGIAFSEQEAKFSVFPHDIAMNIVITENNIFIKKE